MNNRKYGYGFYFRCIQSQLEKAMNEQLKEFDLTKSQLDILRFLKYVKKDHVNQKDIEDADKAVENFLNNFLNKISSNIEYTVKNENGLVYVNIKGEDSTRLIGYRGEALNALQTLLTTVASKNREESVKVILDIGNYKDARKKTLEELARKVEKTVKKTGKSVTLEPMNAYERKILHTELQDSEFVKTYSVGEGDRRRVVIAKK